MTAKEYQLPQRDANKIKSMFDHISLRYDLLNFLMSFGLDAGWRKRVVKEAQLKEGARVLDLACGTGDISFAMRNGLPGALGSVRGMDFSPNMIDLANKKSLKKGQNNISFQVGDALNIDAEDDTYDALTIGFALRNLADLPKAFSEMKRVLKPGGVVLCLDLTRPKNSILGFGHAIFLRTYVPFMGFLFSGDFKAYAYLSRSIREFPPAKVISDTMEKEGLTNVESIPLSGGIATIFKAKA